MDEFANDACRTVVAQICEAVGFHAITDSALETMTDVLTKFIDEIGYQSHSLAELSNRTQTNFLDVKAALDEFGTSIPELQRFMQRNELRYAKAEVQFPIVKNPRPRVRFGEEDTEPLPPHIPSFLPPFPSKHTYLATPQATQSKGDARTAKKQKNKQRRQLEESLLKLNDAEKKPKTEEHFGEAGVATATSAASGVGIEDVSGDNAKDPALLEAARVNDVLGDPEILSQLSSSTLPQKAAGHEPLVSTKARPFSLTLPSSDGRAMRETDAGDRDKERKRQKAAKILATAHDQDGVSAPPAAGEAKSPALQDDAMVEDD